MTARIQKSQRPEPYTPLRRLRTPPLLPVAALLALVVGCGGGGGSGTGNRAPVAADDAYVATEDQVLGAPAPGVLANDTDPDGDGLSAILVGGPSAGTLVLDPDGSFIYTPDADAYGADTFTYAASDGSALSGSATVTINVGQVNDAPSFTKGADQSVLEDCGPITVGGWAAGITAGPGESGQVLTFNVTGNTDPGLFSAGPSVDFATGDLTYTPAADAFGSADVTITLSDDGGTADGGADTSAPQMFTIAVGAVNDAPSFTKGADQSVLEDCGPITVGGWATGITAGPSEVGQVLTFNVTGNTDPGLFSSGPAVDPTTGDLTYTPAADAFGPADVTIALSDDGGTASGGVDTSAAQTFTIAVAAVNDAPSFTKGANELVLEDCGPVTVSGWAAGITAGPGEVGQVLTFNVTGNTDPGLFSAGPAVDSATGDLTYTPAAEAYGSADVTITLSDDGGTADGGADTSAPQTFTIAVTAEDDTPVAYPQTLATSMGVPIAIVLTASDADGDPLNWTVDTSSTDGTLGGTAPTLLYTPTGGFSGVDSFTFYVDDGSFSSNVATVEITVVKCPMVIELAGGGAAVYDTLELKLWLDPTDLGTTNLEPWEMFNAYDTASGWIQVAVVVSRTALTTAEVETIIADYYDEGTAAPSIYDDVPFVVPAFYARYSVSDPVADPAEGSWRWRARVGLLREGEHHFYACARVKPAAMAEVGFPDSAHSAGGGDFWTYEDFPSAKYPHGIGGLVVGPPALGAKGPVAPVAKAPGRYFNRAAWNGVSQTIDHERLFALGHCRCWNLKESDVPSEGAERWSSAFIPFEDQMAALEAAGGNLFSWWLVSWDSNPVHGMDGPGQDVYCEYWDEDRDGEYTLQDVTLDAAIGTAPYRHFDQGRCLKVDDLIAAAEAHNVAVMLTFWPHPDLRETGTGWDVWATSARYGPDWYERSGRWLHGSTIFTNNDSETMAVASDGTFTGWAALGITPSAFVNSWGGLGGACQRNFIRYAVARWGCRRGLGLWELVSELGGTPVSPANESTWRANVALFLDAVSPYKQPLSSATHNVTWEPDITDGDYVSTHGYCSVNDGVRSASMNDDNLSGGGLVLDTDTYREGLLTEHSAYYAGTVGLGKPVFCGEVGACQRRPGTSDATNRDLPLALTHAGAEAEEGKIVANVEWRYRKAVSTYHCVVWTALLSGGAATPLAWADGKEFGEMAARSGNAAGGEDRFGPAYEIDYHDELAACAAVVEALGLGPRLTDMTPTPLATAGGLHVFVLKDDAGALVWASLQSRAAPVATMDLSQFGITWPTGDVQWLNPWTGGEIAAALGQGLTNLPTRIDEVMFLRACAGEGDGSGPHEKEDVLLWITKN